ncbi:HNH endonuclease [Flavobacterium beibuense]|uniref:HNH endonuclease n=1 Tax=Flavobacterium beibuense TaxID=657326 RepID=UPI00068B1426|nr:HNH endonuclease [Flavobacterium beibuense]
MNPDFNKKTIDTLAKRASFRCSNPDCRVNTIGPNTDPNKSTKIGEAAHIYGARVGSKRYNPNMTDSQRAEITNSIWLCRNCHKLIDTDEQKYSPNILFKWREKHEEYIVLSLGNKTEQIWYEEQSVLIHEFDNYPPLIKRIVIDKPDGWEYRLTAELMRFMNDPIFKKLEDLKGGLYLKHPEIINSTDTLNWIKERFSELTVMTNPAVELMNRLTKSWGIPGEPGNTSEIHHVTKLIKNYLEHVLAFEERIHFVIVSEEYQKIIELLKNLIGSQINKLASIPSDLDEIISLNDSYQRNDINPKVIEKEIIFELPTNWEKDFKREINKLQFKQTFNNKNSPGCFIVLLILFIFIIYIL